MAAKKKSEQSKRPYHHGDLRAALIDAALQLIDQRGVKGFTLKDAAVIAGVSIAAPYRHFLDKEALLSTIQQEGFSLFDLALANAFTVGATPQRRIEELGVAYVQFALAHPAQFRVMFGLTGNHEPGAGPSEQDKSAGFRLLVRAVDELHPKAAQAEKTAIVLACWSLVHGFALLHLEGAFAGLVTPVTLEAQLRQSVSLFTDQAATPIQRQPDIN